MTYIRLLPKQQIRIDGVHYEVVRRDGTENWVLQDVQNLAPRSLTDGEAATLFSQGALSFVQPGEEAEEGFNPLIADFSQLPVDLREKARRREAYVRPARERDLPRSATHLRPLIREVAKEIGDKKPPSVATLCRWLASWKKSGERDIRALVPNYFGRGNRTRRLPHEVVMAIDEAVDAVYLQPERMTQKEAWNKAVTDIKRINDRRPEAEALPLPSLRTVSKRIASIDRYELMKARKGKRAADHEFRVIRACPRATRPLEAVEADHTQLDIILLSRDGVVLGRPWLTAVLDRCTRAIVGFHIGFEAPSALSVANALRNSILPKDHVKAHYPGVEAEWPCFGVPETIVVDNGPEFHSAWFDDACAQLGINIQYSPVRSPWFKGKVERWLGTVAKSFCHQLPGTTFSNVQDRGDYQSEKRAAITLDDFVHLFHKWVIDVYMFDWHGGLQGIPRQFWEKGTKEHPVRLPDRREDLDALLGGVEERVLGRQGIQMHGLLYTSEEIRRMRTNPAMPRTVKVRFDPSNLEHVWVVDPLTGISVRIPSLYPEYTTGLSLAQHKAIQRYAKAEAEDYVSIADLCSARDALRRMADESVGRARRLSRNRIARELGYGDYAEPSEHTIRNAAEFMGDSPDSISGTRRAHSEASESTAGSRRRTKRSGRESNGAANDHALLQENQESVDQWQQDDDDPIDPSALGIKSVPRA